MLDCLDDPLFDALRLAAARSPAAREATVSREPVLDRLDDPPPPEDSDVAVFSPAAREATVSREPVLRLDPELVVEDNETAVRSPASREATVSRDPLFLDEELDALSEELEDDLLDDDAGERSALLPEPVSIAIVRLYVVTVTVPSVTVAVIGPAHISSSRTTVSTPALEKTMPGCKP